MCLKTNTKKNGTKTNELALVLQYFWRGLYILFRLIAGLSEAHAKANDPKHFKRDKTSFTQACQCLNSFIHFYFCCTFTDLTIYSNFNNGEHIH